MQASAAVIRFFDEERPARVALRGVLTRAASGLGLGDRTIDVLSTRAQMVRHGARRSFASPVSGDAVAVVVDGTLEIVSRAPDGRTVLVDLLRPGELHYVPGEQTAGTTLVAHGCATVAFLPIADAVRALDMLPGGAVPLLRAACAQTERRFVRKCARLTMPLRARVLHELASLAERFGTLAEPGTRIDVALRHVDLARLVASTRPSVTRCLLQLRRDGLVGQTAGRFVLRRAHAGE